MTTFQRGDRVVVESPIYRGGVTTYEHTSDEVFPGAEGVIVEARPDRDGDLHVDFPNYSHAPVAADALLKVDDLDRLAEERASREINGVALGTVAEALGRYSRTRYVGTLTREGRDVLLVTKFGKKIVDPSTVTPFVEPSDPWAWVRPSLTAESAKAPVVGTATVRIDVRIFVGEKDVTDSLPDLAAILAKEIKA